MDVGNNLDVTVQFSTDLLFGKMLKNWWNKKKSLSMIAALTLVQTQTSPIRIIERPVLVIKAEQSMSLN